MIVTALRIAAADPADFAREYARPRLGQTVPAQYRGVVLADLNKDGRLDLNVANEEACTVMSEPRAVATGSSGYGKRSADRQWRHLTTQLE